jgi:glyoxylase-like metal-dependent hydrolase (beta-lactamase superfamily II)
VGDLDRHGIVRVRADNPGPYTLDGTNTWVVGRDPAWVVDPGPALDAHLTAVTAEVQRRGGAGGIALTHDHEDHAEGVEALLERLGGPPVWDPTAKLGEYLAHRRDREARLLAALEGGLRTRDELLDAAWADAPRGLRPAAALTLAAHLEKLRDEGRLPAGVERG